ncbi:MAG TPA: SMC-Scp complex subunit ScpB [Candidatus Omnitrophota bacterium]|nr:SMC-Scp complex subunit ScpB [Candidatus Omnitrophota bacterium]
MNNFTTQDTTSSTDGSLQHVKGIIESLLFVNEKTVTLDQMKKVLEMVPASDVKKAIAELQSEYEARKCGMMIVEIAGGYQMLSNPLYASYLRNFYKTKHKEKLSKPALESMAIVAYKQPVTRSDIELIRGVNSDGVVAHLLSKELIKVVGRKDVPGHPYLFGTTKQFLEYFGLKSLDDLPTLEEFPTLQPAAENSSNQKLSVEDAFQEASREREAAAQEKAELNDETGILDVERAMDPQANEPGPMPENMTENLTGETKQQDLENEPEESAQQN